MPAKLEGNYTIVSTTSGEAIGVSESGDSISLQNGINSVPLQQAWSLQPTDVPNAYRIVSMLSEKVITLNEDEKSLSLSDSQAGTTQESTTQKSNRQLFKVKIVENDSQEKRFVFVSLAVDGVLTVATDDVSHGGPEIILASYDKLPNQEWNLLEIKGGVLDPGVEMSASVENYADEFSNIQYSTGTNKKICGYSVRYPNGKGAIKQYRYQNYLDQFSKDMDKWSRGKFSYSKVLTASQAEMPDNTVRPKSVLIKEAKRGRSLGACNLNVFKGAFSGSNAPSRNQANCGGSGLSKYCLRHEAGHTWGLGHDGIHNQDTCKKTDSGISQMSGYKTGFNIPHLHWLGWVEENQVKQLQWHDPSADNYIFGEHWVSVRPLSVAGPEDEGEHPYGLVVDLKRSGNRLWLSSNQEGRLKKPGESGYNKQEDALVAMLSPPFETSGLNGSNRWKGTAIYRFIDENRPWDDKLMDDMVVRVVERTADAMLVSIEPSTTGSSCSELPSASYVITKNDSAINSVNHLGTNNLAMEFHFKTEYLERDSLCSKGMCDMQSISVNDLWESCYFENDPERTNLLSNGKVKISSGGHCKSSQTFKTHFTKSDRAVYQDKFSNNIVCKAAYQCFYKVEDTIRFPVNGDKKVNAQQPVGIATIYPNEWKAIINKKRQNESWTEGPY